MLSLNSSLYSLNSLTLWFPSVTSPQSWNFKYLSFFSLFSVYYCHILYQQMLNFEFLLLWEYCLSFSAHNHDSASVIIAQVTSKPFLSGLYFCMCVDWGVGGGGQGEWARVCLYLHVSACIQKQKVSWKCHSSTALHLVFLVGVHAPSLASSLLFRLGCLAWQA